MPKLIHLKSFEDLLEFEKGRADGSMQAIIYKGKPDKEQVGQADMIDPASEIPPEDYRRYKKESQDVIGRIIKEGSKFSAVHRPTKGEA